MKTHFGILWLFLALFSFNTASAQTTVNFSFKIWKNSIAPGNYLGQYTGSASTSSSHPTADHYYTTTNPMNWGLCPGDQLVIQQNCYRAQGSQSFSQVNFNTSSTATIGLSNNNSNGAGVTPIATVCPTSPNPCIQIGTAPNQTYVPNINSWNFGANNAITITLPTTPSNNDYLMIATGVSPGVYNPGCGILYAFIPLNLAPAAPPIADLDICPGASVNIQAPAGFSYDNWSLDDPNINPPTAGTTNYTVDVTHTTSNCTQSDEFNITVQDLEAVIPLPRVLCYDQSTQITINAYGDLIDATNGVVQEINVNGDPIVGNGVFNLPYTIDVMSVGGPGTVTIEYVYTQGGITCSKFQTITIQPEIELNLQSSYAFCSGNFQQICATSSGVAQPGVNYIWTKNGLPFAVGAGPCFTPSSYGVYNVLATDEAGCTARKSFTVYDPGIGIKHPANITFCSLTHRGPRYIGWFSNPFTPLGITSYSLSWTYTPFGGSTVSIPGPTTNYQVPYLGPGTYSAVVNANGCTETINIIVTDLFQQYNNSPSAAFGFSPLSGNQVGCIPSISMTGMNELWTVIDEFNNAVPTFAYSTGIRFSYTPGVEYTVTLKRTDTKNCAVYINQYIWEDAPLIKGGGTIRRGGNARNSNTNTNDFATAASIEAFPNPTTGRVNIRLNDVTANTTMVRVLNALGQTILEKEVQDQNTIELDLSEALSGIYMVEVVNGADKFIEKVIKK